MHVCDAASTQLPPIGSPIANTRIYILDAHGQPAPIGVPGEIHIAGVGVARGYLNRPGLTAGRFLDDPFVAGERMYRTGDVGRWLGDGTIEYLGRNDQQVKLRGFRIEPGEIEARLLQHDGVKEAVVVVREDEPGNKRLVAYCVAREGQEPDAQDLREHVAQALPGYMVPSAFVQLPALPLTPNGKLDRKAFPAPDGGAHVQREYEAPQGPAEQALAQLWQELLQVERVGRQDNFFELGGHSLLAVSLIERMKRQGLHTEVRALFTAPTLAGLAAQVDGTSRDVQVPPNLIPTAAAVAVPADDVEEMRF
jgi:aryl carrier-like protein